MKNLQLILIPLLHKRAEKLMEIIQCILDIDIRMQINIRNQGLEHKIRNEDSQPTTINKNPEIKNQKQASQ